MIANRPSFLQGVLVAALLSLLVAVVVSALMGVIGPRSAMRFVIALSAGLYVGYLLALRGRGAGRVTLAVLWLLGACGIWVFLPTLTSHVIAHTGLIWFIRSALFHRSIVAAAADLALGAVALAASAWAVRHAHSAALATWCYFLVQAAFVAIAPSLRPATETPRPEHAADRFARAESLAQAALNRYGSSS